MTRPRSSPHQAVYGLRKPLVVELFCGRFGWSRGFVAEGYRAVGFDIVHEPYHGDVPEGCSLALQDVLTLHGSQFKDAACIVASPPCQAFSYRAMPWKMAKAVVPSVLPDWWEKPEGNMTPEEMAAWVEWRTANPAPSPSTALFDACFRIQREANECEWCAGTGRTPLLVDQYHQSKLVCGTCSGTGQARHIPLIVENVKGAQPWVGPAKAKFGSFYLWGDVESVGGRITIGGKFGCTLKPAKAQKRSPDGTEHGQGSWFAVADSKNRGVKQRGSGAAWFDEALNERRREATAGMKGTGGGWFEGNDSPMRQGTSKSPARKAASALIAEIPYDLAAWVARCFKPEPHPEIRRCDIEIAQALACPDNGEKAYLPTMWLNDWEVEKRLIASGR